MYIYIEYVYWFIDLFILLPVLELNSWIYIPSDPGVISKNSKRPRLLLEPFNTIVEKIPLALEVIPDAGGIAYLSASSNAAVEGR